MQIFKWIRVSTHLFILEILRSFFSNPNIDLSNKLSNFRITGAMSICFSYLGEFQTNRIRETVLCWMELFWAGGVILLPGNFPQIYDNIYIYTHHCFDKIELQVLRG